MSVSNRLTTHWQGIAGFVAVTLLTAMFVAFLVQIASRYVFRQPLGWTLEACLLCWLWLVFWCSAFTLRHEDHVRFSVLEDSVGQRTRTVFTLISSLCIVIALVSALPATFSFVQFMAIESTSLLKFRFDYVFSIYLAFSVAIVVRYSKRAVRATRARRPE